MALITLTDRLEQERKDDSGWENKMYDFSRRYRIPMGGAPDIHSINHPDFLRARRRYRPLMRPPDLRMTGQAPELPRNYIPSDMWPGMAENWLAPRPGEMPTGQPPVAPELTYEGYKAQPPSVRFAGIQPSEMSPYEIQEYADEMATQRKAQKAQRLQELYEGELKPAPDVIDLKPTYRYTGMRPTRREVSESTGLRMLRRGRISPEELAGTRQALWKRHPSMLGFEAPDLEQDVSRFAGMLSPDLQAERTQQQYEIEHPAPRLPQYETTVTRRMPGGVTLTHRPVSAPELPTELDIEQAKGRLAAEQARKAYWERPPTTTLSPIMRMVDEGLLTLEEGKGLATKEKDDDLSEKDIISIMHTIERALASTYTPLNEPLGGESYTERREYYTKQLEAYRNRLDQIRVEKPERKEGITATNPQTGERIISYDGGKTWQPLQ